MVHDLPTESVGPEQDAADWLDDWCAKLVGVYLAGTRPSAIVYYQLLGLANWPFCVDYIGGYRIYRAKK